MWGEMGKPIILQLVQTNTNRAVLKQSHRKLSVGTGQDAEHSPRNRNAGVSIGDHAVLLFRVDHGGVNCQRGTGVDDWAGSVGNKKNVHFNHQRLHFHFYCLKGIARHLGKYAYSS